MSQAEGLRQKHSWQYLPVQLQAAALLSLFASGLLPTEWSLDSTAALHLSPWRQVHFPTNNRDLPVLFLMYKEKEHRDIFVPKKTQR